MEFLRMATLSAGLYVVPAGGRDPQKPHQEDELYYVVSGRGRMRVGSDDREVTAGSVIFVESQMNHSFYDIQQELVILVFFAPAESS